MLYSMAIVRFVNGLVDSKQMGAYAQSIRKLAYAIDLPAFFVDLRHEATHSMLPSISYLRTSAIQVSHRSFSIEPHSM